MGLGIESQGGAPGVAEVATQPLTSSDIIIIHISYKVSVADADQSRSKLFCRMQSQIFRIQILISEQWF